MPEKITIVETPRDAFQGLPGFIPTEEKIRYVRALMEAGFREIDFGSFVSPRAVPQMRDSEELFRAVSKDSDGAQFIAVIANDQGLERARAAGVPVVGYPLSLSDTFQRTNTGKTVAESWDLVERLQAGCRKSGIELLVYVSMAFGNPYGEPWEPEQIARAAGRLVDLGIHRIQLADTVGKADPDTVRAVFAACRAAAPGAALGAHFHARPDRWQENVFAAYRLGCRRFDAAFSGLGGCPFAEDELVGNTPTEGLVREMEAQGISTGISLHHLDKPLALALEIRQKYGK